MDVVIDYRKYNFERDSLAVQEQLLQYGIAPEGNPTEQAFQLSDVLNKQRPYELIKPLVDIMVDINEERPTYSIDELLSLKPNELRDVAHLNGIAIKTSEKALNALLDGLARNYQLTYHDNELVKNEWFKIYKDAKGTFISLLSRKYDLSFPPGSNNFEVIRYLMKNGKTPLDQN